MNKSFFFKERKQKKKEKERKNANILLENLQKHKKTNLETNSSNKNLGWYPSFPLWDSAPALS